jgi:hypothetical protein
MTTPKLKKRLSDMKITEVSLVDEPANQHARSEIVKRAQPLSQQEHPMRKFAQDTDLDFEDEIEDMEDGAELDAGPEDGDEEDDDLTDEDFDVIEDAFAILRAAAEEDPQDEGIVTLAKAFSFIPALLEARDALTDAVVEAGEEIAKRDTTIAEYGDQIRKMGREPVSKMAEEIDVATLPETIRKQLQKGEVALEAVAKMMAEREEFAHIEKARRLGIGQPETVGPLLMRVAKGLSGESDAAVLEDILKQAQGAIEASPMLKTLGEAGHDAGVEAQIAKAAEDIFKSARASGQELTMEQAISKAYRENPNLYSEYQRARRG